MKNKKAVGSGFMIAVIVAILLIGGLAVFGIMQSTRGVQELIETGGCELAPTITVNTVNGINKGTAVSETVNAIVNGVSRGVITEGTTNFARGEKVKLMLNASNFIDVILPEVTVGCGTNPVNAEMFATSTNTFRVFNTDGNPLSDDIAGGATNQSASANNIALDVRIDGTADESTGVLYLVIEATNTTEVDDIIVSGFPGVTKVDVPEFYSVNTANALTRAYKIDQVLDGATVTGTITLTPETGITMGTGDSNVYITAYSAQAFIDIDGTFQVGVEDSEGTIKYEDTWGFDFSIGNEPA